MSRLREQVANYLRLRRSLGYKLVEHDRFLTSSWTTSRRVRPPRLPPGTRWHGRSCQRARTRAGMEPG